MDLEWDSHSRRRELSLVQIAAGAESHFVLDAKTSPQSVFTIGEPSLKVILESAHATVVMHGAVADRGILSRNGVKLRKLFDTQIAHWLLTGERSKSLAHVLEHWLDIHVDKGGIQMKAFMRTPHLWAARPLPDFVVHYALQDVQFLPALYDAMREEAEQEGTLGLIYERSMGKEANRKFADRRALDAGIAFAQLLMTDQLLRRRCRQRVGFSAEFVRWKHTEASSGRERVGCSASSALFNLSRLSDEECVRCEIPSVKVFGRKIFWNFAVHKPPSQLRLAVERLKKEREIVEANKCGIEVSAVQFDATVAPNSTELREIFIHNTGKKAQRLVAVRLVQDSSAFMVQTVVPSGGIELRPGESGVAIAIGARPQMLGIHRNWISLCFAGFSIGRFLVLRCGDPDVVQQLRPSSEFRWPSQSYTSKRPQKTRPKPLGVQRPISEAPRGNRRHAPHQQANSRGARNVNQMQYYNIPKLLQKRIYSNEIEEKLEDGLAVLQANKAHVTKHKYVQHLQNLLWVEELQLKRDLSKFNLLKRKATRLTRRRHGDLLWLYLPGLAEKRPSVLRGDLVEVPSIWPDEICVKNGRRQCVVYRGRVEQVELDAVGIKFNPEFATRYNNLDTVEVYFVLSRYTLRLQHQGLMQVHKNVSTSTLFPTHQHLGHTKATTVQIVGLETQRTSIFNGCVGEVVECRATTQQYKVKLPGITQALWVEDKNLELATRRAEIANRVTDALNTSASLNMEQTMAVRAIVRAECRGVPYIVFGPPGTGKTTTLVQVVLQNINHSFCDKILVCTPTNAAADFFASRLLAEINPDEHDPEDTILRLCAFSRNVADVPKDLLDAWVVNYTRNRGFETPSLEELKDTPVVIATMATAAKMYNKGVQAHYDMVIIDEAGQATEPEVIAALGPLLKQSTGQLVVAGDPFQLGPVIFSNLAERCGMAVSFLERLICRDVYQKCSTTGQYDARVLTKLVHNYRAHPALLDVPNQEFYDGELVACGPPHLINRHVGWSHLPNPRVPLIFHAVAGDDEREGTSPSWFNRDECGVVLNYIKRILTPNEELGGKPKISAKDIGVITPYNKQAQKIRTLLKSRDFPDVTVGSTETFQGQERQVIIISTVRSNKEFLEFDLEHRLGFLDNPKRFNVAITRAIGLLIVVGNPQVLRTDPHWRAFLQYAANNDACLPNASAVTGNVESDEELQKRLNALVM